MRAINELSDMVTEVPASAEAIIQVNGLYKAYGSVQAVNGISFQVYRGEVFGLLGPNGAGKTTTLESIEGMLPIDRGTIRVAGIDVGKDPQAVRRTIGISLQKTAFFERLTLLELLRLFADLYGKGHEPVSLLKKVNLQDLARRPVKSLSGGQQQRFALAVALVNDPPLIFLDEPTTGLDPQARRNLWDLIRSLKSEGRSIVLTTHYMEEAEELCDRVAILDSGRIIALDTPPQLVRQLLAKGFHKQVEMQPANLEDVFLQMTGRQLREGS